MHLILIIFCKYVYHYILLKNITAFIYLPTLYFKIISSFRNALENDENVTTFIYLPSNNEKLKDSKGYKNHSFVQIDVDPPNYDDLQNHDHETIKRNNCENFQPNIEVKNQSNVVQANGIVENFGSFNSFGSTSNNTDKNKLNLNSVTKSNIAKKRNHAKNAILNSNKVNPAKRKCQDDIRYKCVLRTVCALCGKMYKLKENNDTTKSKETLAAQILTELQEVNPLNETEHLQLTKKGIEICDKVLSNHSINLNNLLTNDSELMAFTGINFELLNQLSELVTQDEIKNGQRFILSAKERLLMCLCKLRLNLSFDCLAMLFSIHEQSCINNFFSLMKILSEIMKKTIYWPKNEELVKNLPECFQSFKQTRVILNCCDVQIEKQVCVTCQVELDSKKNQQSSIKFVFGVAPSGLIIFKSDPYEGQESDNSIFTRTKISDNIDSTKEAIMTDKTLNIKAECAQHSITLIKPPEIGKKKNLARNDVELIKNIAAARIHVDRTLQRFKKYKIMQTTMSWRILPYINNICTIIAGLVNMSNPVLPKTVFSKH